MNMYYVCSKRALTRGVWGHAHPEILDFFSSSAAVSEPV